MASIHITGQCASAGFAAGRIVVVDRAVTERRPSGDPAEEARTLREAIGQAAADVRALAERSGETAADILFFQVAMLEDEALSDGAFAEIAAGAAAGDAWRTALNEEIRGYEGSNEEYFRARASDLADLRDRVLNRMNGASASEIPPGSILLGDEMTPSQFLGTDWQGGAILLRGGSATSHVAMLARARGVPMVVGLGAGAVDTAALLGREVLVDAEQGQVVLDPEPEDRARFERMRAVGASEAADLATYLRREATTIDGTRVTTLINVADPSELEALDPAICDGIGLVRTELLFEGGALPDEERQVEVYADIVRWAAGRPVTFRTLDAGGDKPVPGLTPAGESNPFLGVRGVRLTLKRPDVFLPQLRALARAAALGPVEVMIPMVAVPGELQASRALLDQACAELAREGVAHVRPALGMMVEVPAAALTLDLFDADFLSIGSNDLTQYVMAAGRDIADVASLADTAEIAVMRLIGTIARHGRDHGIKVSLCGDAGGDARLVPLLLRQGLRVLSMSPRQLAVAKRAIIATDLSREAEPGDG